MTIYVDAWLDCKNPSIQVKEKQSNNVLADFDKSEIYEMIHNGDVCIEDFCRAELSIQIDLVKTLLLLKCKKDIRDNVLKVYKQVKSNNGDRNVLPFPMLMNKSRLLRMVD